MNCPTDWLAVPSADATAVSSRAHVTFHDLVVVAEEMTTNGSYSTIFALVDVDTGKTTGRQVQIWRRDGITTTRADGTAWSRVDPDALGRHVQLMPWLELVGRTETLPFVACHVV